MGWVLRSRASLQSSWNFHSAQKGGKKTLLCSTTSCNIPYCPYFFLRIVPLTISPFPGALSKLCSLLLLWFLICLCIPNHISTPNLFLGHVAVLQNILRSKNIQTEQRDQPKWWSRKPFIPPHFKSTPKSQLSEEQPSVKKTSTYQEISSIN